jgi:trans-AT polyketide synthase/acyltransferase/oxidoreductase domain-containing protein
MDKPIIFMFSGQGSQYYHMGEDLFVNNNTFKKWALELDKIAYEIVGESVVDKIFDKNKTKGSSFDRTLYTHPAIFIVEYALAQTLIEEGIKPDIVLGTSLGEFVSAAIAEIIKPKEALEMIIKQAQLIESNCDIGSMIAIIDNPKLYSEIAIINKNSQLASINYNRHFVVSGEKKSLNRILDHLKENNIMHQELPVSYGFHSSYINQIEAKYREYLNYKKYNKPKIPFISCLEGDYKEVITGDYFWKVVREPMQFPKAIEQLQGRSFYYLDLGPSGTMASFTKQNLTTDNTNIYSIMTPFGREGQHIDKIKKIISSTNNLERKDSKMLAYVFPGQGSQQKGMGGKLFKEYKDLVTKADKILGYSIEELCMEDKEQKLGQTEFTQPALYVVNVLRYLNKLKETGIKPDYVAGHSLGEYNALFAAGVFDFEAGLKLVKKRGELMSKATGGGMAAVIGLSEEKIKEVLKKNNFDSIYVANYNTPSQIVISGVKEDIEKAQSFFEAAGARMYAILKVSGAFHSRYMEESKKEFDKYLNKFKFKEIQIPIISNVKARPYKQEDIKEVLGNQMTHSVKWTESIRYLMGKGEIDIQQVGPGMVVSGLVRNIKKEAEPLIVNEEEEIKKEDIVEKVEKDKTAKKIIAEKEEKLKTDKIKENKTHLGKSEEDKDAKSKEEQDKEITMETSASKKSLAKTIDEKDIKITPQSLGDDEFKKEFNLKYAYITGSMYKGISSKEMVVKMGKAGLMGFFGTGGLSIDEIEESINYIQSELNEGQAYGMNLLYNPVEQEKEEAIVDLYLKYGIKNIEASAYMSINYPLVKYRLAGIKRDENGVVYSENKVIAKVSRPEVAEVFLSPAPERIINRLLETGKISEEQAELSKEIPMVDSICIEADSGGHTDQGVAYALMPAILKLRDNIVDKFGYRKKINVGAAGGIGTPEAAAAAFVLGADFIVTGSINQCTVEARTSEQVKDLLQQANVQDTEYAPAGDMFELGAKVQVLKKGLFFPARANKLYELYRQYNSLDEIDAKTKKQLQERYFGKTFEEIFEDAKMFYPAEEIEKANKNPKQKMAMVFKWYFGHSTSLALNGSSEQKVNYQVHCGSSLGAFNQWVKGSDLEDWRNRNVDVIADKIMIDTAEILNDRFKALAGI